MPKRTNPLLRIAGRGLAAIALSATLAALAFAQAAPPPAGTT
jgi:hypothetical protein